METIMSSKNVIDLYSELDQAGIRIWVDGGWSVDALLGTQLRPHKDLDIALDQRDLDKFLGIMSARGYKEIRRDNEWNFVLGKDAHEVDAHVFIRDEKGNIVDGIKYPTESLTGTGTIDGHSVRCISAKFMVEFLAPWVHKWPDKYLQAISELCKKFGIPLPDEYIKFKK